MWRLLTFSIAWLLGLGASGETAHASGPIERLVQVFAHPENPDTIVLRYGVASQGFLFSRDRGESFRAMCSTAVAPERTGDQRLNKVSTRLIADTAALALDGDGRLSLAFSGGGAVWSDDGTGCSWTSAPELDGGWAHSIRTDPRDSGVLWAAVSTTVGEKREQETRFELVRRDRDGAWSIVSPIKLLKTGEGVLNADLIVYASATQRRLVVSANIIDYGITADRRLFVSDDDGESWREQLLPAELISLNLLAIDPNNRDRVLAAVATDNTDRLLLSQDGGENFADYQLLRAIAGVTFDAQGRLFLADAGDGSNEDSVGGLFTAAAPGEPLTKVGSTQFIDCVHYEASSGRLYVCSRDSFGVADPETGEIEQLVRLEEVPALLECPDRDIYMDCKYQLNEGASWCCAGHFPFTPFCGEYNVKNTPDGRRVFCGLTGREYDRPGSTMTLRDAGEPEITAEPEAFDGGVDAGDDGAARARKPRDRCSLGPAPGAGRVPAALWLAGLVALLFSRRRAARR